MGYGCGRQNQRPASTLRSSVINASGGQGLGTNQSHPARVARCSSPDPSCAVSATTGMCAVRLSALSTGIAIAAGERILTEISRKYDLDALSSLLTTAGLGIEAHYEPINGFFSLLLARPG